MANVGSISIELELRDGDFIARSRRAGQVVRELNGSFLSLNSGITVAERGVGKMLGTLRDVAIVGHGLSDVFYGLKTLFVDWSLGIVKANAELEKMGVLLEGLSKSGSKENRIREAADDMNYLIDRAKNAPFSLKELTNSFVKMKTTGIDGVREKVTALTDAIARFGGGEQELHRATVAIQQMASKGVVSMEELRQQIGEAVPEAMKMMADGMGISMATLVAQVSKGTVAALPAINAMMSEIERTMSGSAARMMKTWSGMSSVLNTEWLLLQKTIGDAGMFDSSKAALRDLIDFMGSGTAIDLAARFGASLGEMVQNIEVGIKKIYEFSDTIEKSATAILAWVAAVRGMAILGGTVASIAAFDTAVGALMSSMRALTTVTTVTAVAGLGGLFGATTSVTRAMTNFEIIAGRLGILLAALGGPLKVITFLVAGAAAAYALFGDRLKDVSEKAEDARKEIDALKNQDGELNIFSDESAREQLARIETLKQELDRLIKKKNDQQSLIDAWKAPVSSIEPINDEIEQRSRELLNNQENTYKKINEIKDREVKRGVDHAVAKYEEELTAFSRMYEIEKDKARSFMEERIKNGTNATEAEKSFAETATKLSVDLYEAKIAASNKYVETVRQEMEKLKGNNSVQNFIVSDAELKKLEEAKFAIQTKLESIRQKKKETSDQKVLANLDEQVREDNEKLKSIEAQIEKLKGSIIELRNNSNEVIQFNIDTKLIDAAYEKIKQLVGYRDQAAQGRGIELIESGGESVADFMKGEAKKMEDALKDYIEAYSKTQKIAAEGKVVADALKVDKGFEMRFVPTPNLNENFVNQIVEKSEILGSSTKLAEFKSQLMNAKTVSEQMFAKKNIVEWTEKVREATEQLGGLKKMQKESADNFENADKNRRKALQKETDSYVGVSLEEHMRDWDRENNFQEKSNTLTKEQFQTMVQIREEHKKSFIELEKSKELLFNTNKQYRKEQEDKRKAEHQSIQDAKDARDRVKWLADQEINLRRQVSANEIKLIDNGILASKHQLEEKLKDIRAAAEATAMANGLGAKDDQGIIIGKNQDVFDYGQKAVDQAKPILEQNAIIAAEVQKKQRVEQIEKEINGLKIGLMRDSYQRGSELIEAEVRNALEANKRLSQIESERSQMERLIHEKRLTQLAELARANETAFQKMMAEPQKFNNLVSDVGVRFVDGMSDSFTELALNGTTSFRQLTASVLSDIGKMITKFVILGMVKQAIGLLGSAFGPSIGEGLGNLQGSITGNPFNGSGPYASFGAAANGGIVHPFASGGMMSQSDMLKGGVRKTPHLALFAEAGIPEAFIPMMDRKNIAVSLNRDAMGNILGASIPLPSGQSIPGKIIGESLSKFAQGGVSGGFAHRGAVTPISRGSSEIGVTDAILVRIEELMRSSNEISQSMIEKLTQSAAMSIGSSQQELWKTFENSGLSTQSGAPSQRVGVGNELANVSDKVATGGVSVAINITNNQSGTTESRNTTGDGPVDAKNSWETFANRIKTIVNQELIEQKRPGGILYQ